MAYNKGSGVTDQPQKGGAFESGTQQGITSNTQRGGTFNTGTGNTVGVTSANQRGGVFDGIVKIDGAPGPQGPVGPVGPPITITASATASAAGGTTPSVQITTTTPSEGVENLAFNFQIPSGEVGPAKDITASATASGLAAGSQPTVTAVATDTGTNTENIAFTFGIPAGAQGEQGPKGDKGDTGDPGAAATVTVGTTTTGAAGSQASVTNSGTTSAAVFNFTIPQGAQGQKGDQGNQGPQGNPGPQGRSISTITASASTVGNTVTVTENITYSDSTMGQISFSFPVGGSANNLTFGTADPVAAPAVIPGLYVNTTAVSLWAYLTNQWVAIDKDVSFTTTDGTIKITNTGGTYDVSVAQDGATVGQLYRWNGTKWAPYTLTYDLQAGGADNNILQLTVAGGPSETVEMVSLTDVYTDTTDKNSLFINVNGVESTAQDIIDRTSFGASGLSFNSATRNLQATINGVASNIVNIPGGSGGGYPSLTEPSWRTVTGSGTSNITVKDNVQNPVSVFAGTATPRWVFTLPTDIGNAVANTSTITVNSTNIDGVVTSLVYNVPSGQIAYDVRSTFLYVQAPANNRFWFNQFGYHGTTDYWTLVNDTQTSVNEFSIRYDRANNGTRDPIHTNSSLSITFAGFTLQTGGATRTITATLNQFQDPNVDVPGFRNLNVSDIEPLFANYPANGQVASWQNNQLSWVNQSVGSVTTVTQGNGITVSDAGVGANHAYTISAALTAQDSGVAVSGSYSAINLGNNLRGTISGGVLTIDSMGGGGEGPYIFNSLSASATQPAAVPFWDTTTNGTGTVSLSISATNANGYTVGPTYTINPAATSGSNPFVVASSRAGIAYTGSVSGTGRGTDNTTTPFTGSATPVTVTQTTYVPAFFTQTSSATPPTFTTSSTATSGNAAGSVITYPSATATTQYNFVATTRPLSALALRTPLGDQPLVSDIPATTQTISGTVFNIYAWTSLVVGRASTLVIS